MQIFIIIWMALIAGCISLLVLRFIFIKGKRRNNFSDEYDHYGSFESALFANRQSRLRNQGTTFFSDQPNPGEVHAETAGGEPKPQFSSAE